MTPRHPTVAALDAHNAMRIHRWVKAVLQAAAQLSATAGSGTAIPLPTGAGGGALLLAVVAICAWKRKLTALAG